MIDDLRALRDLAQRPGESQGGCVVAGADAAQAVAEQQALRREEIKA